MTPLAKRELRDFCERARRERLAREQEPYTPTDKIDLLVAVLVGVALLVVVTMLPCVA